MPLSKMELSAVGERVFAAESIIKRRIRKVSGLPGRDALSGSCGPGPRTIPVKRSR